LRQVGLAVLQYEGQRGQFPPGRVGCDDTGDELDHHICARGIPSEEKSGASGFVYLLPFVEEQATYDQLDVEHGGLWNRNVNDLYWYQDPGKCKGIKVSLSVWRCPSDLSRSVSDVYFPVLAATSNYAFVHGTLGPDTPSHIAKYENNGLFVYVVPRKARQVRDGLTSTMLAGEVTHVDTWESSNTWSYALVNADCLRSTRNPLNTKPGAGVVHLRQNGAFGSRHPGGALFCLADNRVEFLREEIDIEAYRALSTIAGREVLSTE
jgi:hypothetical protein